MHKTLVKKSPGRPKLTHIEREARKLVKQSDPMQLVSNNLKDAFTLLISGQSTKDAATAVGMTENSLKARLYEAAPLAALAIMRAAHREAHRDQLFHQLLGLAGLVEGITPAEKDKDRIYAIEKALELCGDNYRERVYERAVKAREAGADVPVPYGRIEDLPQMPTLQLIITDGQAETGPVIEHEQSDNGE